MTLHEVVNVSLPRAIVGRQLFVPRPEALIESVARLHEYLHSVLHSKLVNSDALIMSINLAHRFIHDQLPANLNQRG